ncbi:unnamed protein product [Rotaria magnacalcarata]
MLNISCKLLLVVILGSFASAIRIGSFNLHQYGPKKSSNATLTNLIAQIINDFDLAAIQEITDVSLKAPIVLHQALNGVSKLGPYTMTLSERVGDSTSKEQYIFFNREATSGLQLLSASVYDDSRYDYFERAPSMATYKVKKPGKSGVKTFTIMSDDSEMFITEYTMNVHLRPDDAYQESVNMRHVIEDFIIRHPEYFSQTTTSYAEAIIQNVENPTSQNKPSLNTQHPILIVGDFNADCTYISLAQQDQLRSIFFADFKWMINNQVKTNTRQTCTYDRFLINGNNFVNAIIARSNTTVDFGARFGMTLDDALRISDHLPIKFDINW